MDGHPLPIDELKGVKAVESIDLSGKNLSVTSAILIGACIAGNEHLKELKCASNPNVVVVRYCRLSHINSAQAILAFDAHSLAKNALQEKGAKVIAEVIVKMPQLTNLK